MSKRKTVRSGVREISPVSIYGEVYGGRLEEEVCFKSGVKKRRYSVNYYYDLMSLSCLLYTSDAADE